MRNSDPFDTGGVGEPRRGENLEAVSAKTLILGKTLNVYLFSYFGEFGPLVWAS